MGRTCRECGWMKDVGAASLLETKLWVLTRQRGSTLSASLDRNNLYAQLVAADAARGVRREAGMAKRGAHRRQVVLLLLLLLKKPSVSVNVLGCFALQSEQLVDFEFLASRENAE